MIAPVRHGDSLTTAGLFAGIGGIELGLEQAGHRTVFFCEIDPAARRVLRSRFPHVRRRRADIRVLTSLPRVGVLTAGFPCQDLSQAGTTAGIHGSRSGLIATVFDLLRKSPRSPRWLLLENVPFMLQLDRGRAMEFLTRTLSDLGFAWAYRVVEARAFGVPQRRQRVLLLASRTEDPRGPLLNEDAGEPPDNAQPVACGFYWTEGSKGLGWARDAVPTLKGGSTIGIPSPPAIWMTDGRIVTPDIRDAERLQGFPADWTLPALTKAGLRQQGVRWKLVGNAVCVPMARWIGERLALPEPYRQGRETSFAWSHPWPRAAWGRGDEARAVEVSMWPVRASRPPLTQFLRHPARPLSARAAAGFLSRAERSSLRFPPGFLPAVRDHLRALTTTSG